MRIGWWAAGVVIVALTWVSLVKAQEDPVSQCADGVQLFLDGQTSEALPLLEVGFSNRQQSTFANTEDLGFCALALGLVWDRTSNLSGALGAYQVALDIFQESGNRQFEGPTLNNIGAVYDAQGRYGEALDSFQQALAIRREVGDRAGEGITLNNIGLAYVNQGRYVEALESYQQALTIAREVGDRAGEGTTLNNIGDVYRLQGQYRAALDSFQQALTIAREEGATGLGKGSPSIILG